MSSTASTTSSAAASASSSASASLSVGSNLKVVGIILAIASGVLIGSSFVFKKKGLLRSQAGGVAGEGVAYLKSPLWWTGMIMMILGELCNFAAYAFVEAIVVTPLGALSVVVCAILSSFFLKEKLSFFGWLGCGLCIIGSIIIALNGPSEPSVGEIREFEKLFISPGFLAYTGTLIAISLAIIFYFAPRYGKKSMLWYIMVCSMIGGISVSVTTGLGAAIVRTAQGDSQFKYWFIYFLMVFVAVTLITEVYYLNVALALFNTAMVTPTYYVIFTFFSMVTTIVLFKGLKATIAQILTVVLGFLVICCGITILQMSKIDPEELGNRLDRRSTLLLQAARSNTGKMDEKDLSALEDPGIDSIRGSFGPLGSMIRARSVRRMSMSSHTADSIRSRRTTGLEPHFEGLQRHQLYDAPVPSFNSDRSLHTHASHAPPRTPTIKFDTEDVVHKYPTKGLGADLATHERRETAFRSSSPGHISMTSMDPIREESSEGLAVQQPRPQHPIPGLPPIDSFDSTAPLRTAPATMFASQKGLPRQDPFETSPATSTGAAFPASGSSSSPLPMAARFSPTSDEEGYIARRLGHGGRGHKRTSSDRKYPKGVDDKEESVSLVRSPSPEDSSVPSDEDDVQMRSGGIRLVGSSSGRF
ncbi:DUF803-domain-containing protein [Fomitiporia mediterranea MF3/22]|uniref:DUF803-domain-containing protein n=1 Tax=Fomitiporia mediterranea (strain MF3/22) TaxID=694068 RepID=UPI0004409B8B|nr:DUF803-domain-containing protein [Fomitiporia mediterranea MF3/22]EJD02690.1 DUF803-domain-containing protein [Fomitiporia mediterranea MF3/22]